MNVFGNKRDVIELIKGLIIIVAGFIALYVVKFIILYLV